MHAGKPTPAALLHFPNNHPYSFVINIQVCKLFHSIISGSTKLVYKIELHASYMEDGDDSSLDTVDRLNALREHNKAWNNLEWTHHDTVLMCEGHSWKLSGGILAAVDRSKRNIMRSVTVQNNSQDLLVLLELAGTFPDVACKIHFRNFSGEPHPCAAVPQIRHAPQSMDDDLLLLMQICGPHIAILFIDQVGMALNSFHVWNWHTGHQKVHMRMLEFGSFAFMSEDLILAAILRSDEDSGEDTLHMCELRFPEIKGEVRPVPFYAERKDFIFAISLRVVTRAGIQEHRILVVPLSTLRVPSRALARCATALRRLEGLGSEGITHALQEALRDLGLSYIRDEAHS
ncbi:hypothetical protein BU15DRAFT_72169 [Melanogaster broomeanus]|nr:hypothetical protein BU15DRAFT_72169 [Melanogaster broomeanus]